MEHFDVLIVGAGLSGIGAGYHLQTRCPERSYAIFEARATLGGTWDLFRYPGIRSDSDMYTLGYSFRPWEQAKAIADGPSILNYIKETARIYGIDRKIRYQHRIVAAAWSTPDARWTIEVQRPGHAENLRVSCGFVFVCGGYYSYESGYTPEFPGIERFKGRIVHPQKWDDGVDYQDKRVVVIGSGATAVTLVPELAKSARHVTMLQRSPTYVVSRPSEDRMANAMRRWLPSTLAYAITRWKRVLLGMYFYDLCQRKPERTKGLILRGVRMAMGPDYDVERHFSPRYKPWDQRLCLVPDGDLFLALRSGRASIATDQIETFTETGVKLAGGTELAADLLVTATGLNLEVLSGMQVSVDGSAVDMGKTLTYKGMMYAGIPNLASSFGYTNASWTLKCDLTCEFVCRLLNHMKAKGYRQCTPAQPAPDIESEPWVNFSSGYFQRSLHKLPKQGSKAPWRLYQNYARDLLMLRYGRIEDGVLRFSNPVASQSRVAA
jgi:cation diffusion facilitator CzcD-associated flavoprotein CzcO